MNKPPDFTPKEKFHASLYKDPSALFRRTLYRTLGYLIPSVALMIAWLITKDPAYAYMGYGILFYQTVYKLILAKRGIQTTNQVLTKYETRGESDEDAA